jgi:hypothetical protein
MIKITTLKNLYFFFMLKCMLKRGWERAQVSGAWQNKTYTVGPLFEWVDVTMLLSSQSLSLHIQSDNDNNSKELSIREH